MSSTPQVDLMVLFFEAQGVFLTTSQAAFCRLFLKHGSAVVAARKAGYPDPDVTGPQIYLTYKSQIEAWAKHINHDAELVLNGYRRMAQEMIPYEDEHGNKLEFPNDKIQKVGFEGLRALLGLDAGKKLDLNLSGSVELPASTKEMMERMYVQSDVQQQS